MQFSKINVSEIFKILIIKTEFSINLTLCKMGQIWHKESVNFKVNSPFYKIYKLIIKIEILNQEKGRIPPNIMC